MTALAGGTSTAKFLRLIQAPGGIYRGSYSTNGTSYTAVGGTVSISMGTSTVLMGLAVTAGVPGGTTLATAAFDHVRFVPTVQGTTYGSDAAGNRTSVADVLGTSVFAFDALSQMSSQYPPSVSGPTTLTYNGDGQLTRKAPDGESAINFIYDQHNLLQEVDGHFEGRSWLGLLGHMILCQWQCCSWPSKQLGSGGKTRT